MEDISDIIDKVHCADCLEFMRGMPDNSVDTIITDPPYGLKFMGKGWDKGVPGIPYWLECLRVSKPGASLLAFGGTRTYHRLTCAIEDAGWEIRDCIMWLYGSGFPKAHDIGKSVEKVKVGGIRNLKQIGSKKGIKCETGTQGYSFNQEYVANVLNKYTKIKLAHTNTTQDFQYPNLVEKKKTGEKKEPYH